MNTLRRIKTYRKAKEVLERIYDNKSNHLIIHYSCESFYDRTDGKSPRITSIAVRHLNTGQTTSFSIHKVAEIEHINPSEISSKYDYLEKQMLSNFYRFVKNNSHCSWIHWNMRDVNYGFEALKHRAGVLGVKTIVDISDDKKYDLSRILIEKYTKLYTSHPRLDSLVKLNKISSKHFLTGDKEAELFEERDYIKLHQSTLAKVDVFDNILNLAAVNRLKTKSKWYHIYGINFQSIFELSKDNWIIAAGIGLIGGLFMIGLGKLFS